MSTIAMLVLTGCCSPISGWQIEGIDKVENVVYQAAINGSIPAATFYLDRRGGWGQRLEVTGKDGGPVTLAAMREQFADVIEGTAKPVSKKKPKQITDESD